MAANQAYFGICPSCPANIETGAGNVTVAGGAGLATFTVAQVNTLMGVGAAVTFNATTYYVAGRVDTSNWYLVDATGVAAPNGGPFAVTGITHPFGSMSAAEAGYAALTGNADITAAGCDLDLCFPCYCEDSGYTADTTAVIWDGATCDATHEIFVYTPQDMAAEVNLNQRPSFAAFAPVGGYIDECYRMEVSTTRLLDIDDAAGNIEYIHFTGIQFYSTSNTGSSRWLGTLRGAAGSHVWLDGCHLRMVRYTGAIVGWDRVFLAVLNPAPNYITLRSCVFEANTLCEGAHATGIRVASASEVNILNCTAVNVGRIINATVGNVRAYNNLWLHNDTANAIAGTTSFDSDFNVYRDVDEGETHSTLTTQTDAQLLTDATGTPDAWDYGPNETTPSALIGAGIKLRDEDSLDIITGEGIRLVRETHPVVDYTNGDSWLPTDFLDPRGRWTAGAAERIEWDVIKYGICPGAPPDFKVAGECAILNGIAYFQTAQNHALMGVGARLDIAAALENFYVVAKLDEYRWVVRGVTGARPTDYPGSAITSLQHTFASQSAFEAGYSILLGTTDLPGAEMSVHGCCYCEQTGFTVDNTAVTYDGTTCDATYQLWVYTPHDTVRECNMTHRNQGNGGAWDATLYRLELATTPILQTGNSALQHLHLVGIQFYQSSNAQAARQCLYCFNRETGTLEVESCIIRVNDCVGNNLRQGLRVDQGLATVRNCISYLPGVNPMQTSWNCLAADTATVAELTVEDCTIYGWYRPILGTGISEIDYNSNAFIGNTGAGFAISSTHDYNVYDANEGETHGHLTVQADAALFTAVAGNRDTWDWTPIVGSDLINNGLSENHRTKDFEAEAGRRPQNQGPCAGAIERVETVCVFGICPNCPADFKEGAAYLTIVNGIGTFTLPQRNVLFGVGARVTYGGATIAYVKEIINPFQCELVTGAGAAAPNAADQLVNSITHPFGSQSAAEAGYAALTGNASLVAGDFQLWLPCYCEQTTWVADTAAVQYDGPTGDFGHWMQIYTPWSTIRESVFQHRNVAGGAWEVEKYRLVAALAGYLVNIDDTSPTIQYIAFKGIQLYQTLTPGATRVIYFRAATGSYLWVEGCVLRCAYDAAQLDYGIHTGDNDGKVLTVVNSIFLLDEEGAASHLGVYQSSKDWLFAYHCLVFNFRRAFVCVAGATTIAKNNCLLHDELGYSGIDTGDYNLYRDVDEGEANGILTVQSDFSLFLAFDAVDPEDSNWTPNYGSELTDTAMDATAEAVFAAYKLAGDLDHPAGTEWRPQDALALGRTDIGPLSRYGGAGVIQWYKYW